MPLDPKFEFTAFGAAGPYCVACVFPYTTTLAVEVEVCAMTVQLEYFPSSAMTELVPAAAVELTTCVCEVMPVVCEPAGHGGHIPISSTITATRARKGAFFKGLPPLVILPYGLRSGLPAFGWVLCVGVGGSSGLRLGGARALVFGLCGSETPVDEKSAWFWIGSGA